jgi:hypothetical protein
MWLSHCHGQLLLLLLLLLGVGALERHCTRLLGLQNRHGTCNKILC